MSPSLSSGLFVTGTDTSVGKTTVSCAILAALRHRGRKVLGHKPVETGCAVAPSGARWPADAALLARAASGTSDEPPHPSTVALLAPLAPAVAADAEGVTLSLDELVDRTRARARVPHDLLLVEGAGGLLVPLTSEHLVADLAARIGYPLLLVARDGLGTINHTLLTLEAARQRGLAVVGVVLTAADGGTSREDAQRNAQEIARRGPARVLGRLPHVPRAGLVELAEAAERELALDEMCR